MDVPAVEVILSSDVSKGYAGVSVTLINNRHELIYIQENSLPQSKYLTSDWGDLTCAGVKVKYNGLRYNVGSDVYATVKPGEKLTSSKINLADDYRLPIAGTCSFTLNLWVSTKPVINDDLPGVFSVSSNTVEFRVDDMGFDKVFLQKHKEFR